MASEANSTSNVSMEATPGTTSNPRPFRLLDLPPELRERIYISYYSDTAPQQIELFTVAPSHAPNPSLTQTSHLIRRESLNIYTSATNTFWRHRTFLINIEPSTRDAVYGLTDTEQKIRALISKAETFPAFPFTALKFTMGWAPSNGPAGDITTTLRLLDDGRVEGKQVLKMEGEEGARENDLDGSLQETAREFGFEVVRSDVVPACWDLVGIARTMLAMYTGLRS